MKAMRRWLFVVGLVIIPACTIRSVPSETENPTLIHPTKIHPTNTASPIPKQSQTATSLPTPTISPTPGLGSTRNSPIDGMVQVYIPEGEFLMGSSRFGSLPNEDPHYVYLDSYWIDQTEVTGAMFSVFLASELEETLSSGQISRYQEWFLESFQIEYNSQNRTWHILPGNEDHPIAYVTWDGAQAYCAWAGRRLPTEAEWEKAGRGPQNFSFPWGNEFDCSQGNFQDYTDSSGDVILGGDGCDGFRYLAPVGSFPGDTSSYGVKDMAGNINEWVYDWYDEFYYRSSPYENPVNIDEGNLQSKVTRGGSLVTDSWVLTRLAYRGHQGPKLGIGFRCAQSAESP